MSCFDKLTKEDIAFQEAWLEETHGTDHMPWEQYLKNYWAPAKDEYLTNLFDGNLIIKKSFVYKKSQQDIKELMSRNTDLRLECDCICNLFDKVINEYVNAVYKNHCEKARRSISFCLRYGLVWGLDFELPPCETDTLLSCEPNINLEELITDCNTFRAVTRIVHSVIYNREDFINNKYSGDDLKVWIKGANKFFRINNGEKPIRILTTFFKFMQEIIGNSAYCSQALEEVEQLRITISQELNTKESHGTLCLSIHPMDYMTMSDNGCDWSSCMRWRDGGGEYHAGTLEMMTSPYVVVAYLESANPWYPLAFYSPDWRRTPWSNKKWRELFIVTPNFMCGIKGYPYESETLDGAVMEILRGMQAAHGAKFTEVTEVMGTPPMVDNISIGFSTELMYNDTHYSAFTHYCYREGSEEEFKAKATSFKKFIIHYGKGMHCIECGELRMGGGSEREDNLCCNSCRNLVQCACCGEMFDADGMTEIGGEYYCEDCLSEHLVTSDITGEDFLTFGQEVVEVCFPRKRNPIYVIMEREIADTIPKDCIYISNPYDDLPLWEVTTPFDLLEVDGRLQKYLLDMDIKFDVAS